MLSNETTDPVIHHRSIIAMGDTLASRDMLFASHICYLTAQCPFGWYRNRSERLVLLGSKQSVMFSKFCHNSAIRCTELFEYCQRLGNAEFVIPAFQVYKFLYACRLLDCGLVSQAFHYCEVVGKALLRIDQPHVVLLGELIKLVDRLKFSEAQLNDTGDGQLFLDPDWLVQIRCRHQTLLGENYCSETYQSPAEETSWTQDSNKYSDFTEGQAEAIDNPSTETESSNPPYCAIPHTDAQFEGTYSLMSHSYSSEEQAPKTIAPVPLYPTQQPMTLPPVTPTEMFGPPSVSVEQSYANDSSTYHDDLHNAMSSSSPRNYTDTGGDFSAEAMIASENDATVGKVNQFGTFPSEDNKTKTQSAKASKPGWFSGWFKSKPKDEPKEEIPDPDSPTEESTANFPFPPPPPRSIPKTEQPQFNPFSKRAGQSQNQQQTLSQGP